MRYFIVNLYKEVKTMGGTWDSDYAFIYEFLDILERLFEVIANFFNGLAGGGSTTPEA